AVPHRRAGTGFPGRTAPRRAVVRRFCAGASGVAVRGEGARGGARIAPGRARFARRGARLALPGVPLHARAARRRQPRVRGGGGLLNAVGLANPGLVAAREHELPWLAARLKRARVLVNVAGATVADYVEVIAGLADQPVIAAFEINASCPNTSAGGLEFAATT